MANMENNLQKELYIYLYVGGELRLARENTVVYVGGHTDGIIAKEDIGFDGLINAICQRLCISPEGKIFKFFLKFNHVQLQPLRDEISLRALFAYNDNEAHVYVFKGETSRQQEQVMVPGQLLSSFSLSTHSSEGMEGASRHRGSSTQCGNSSGHSHGIVSQIVPNPRSLNKNDRWSNNFGYVGQVFNNAQEFRDALMRYAIANRFNYKYMKNSKKAMNVRCAVQGCQWKLTAYGIRNSDNLMVSTFINEHKHSAADECSMVRIVKPKLLANMFEETIRYSPLYTPRQIRQDLLTMYNVKVKYSKAWKSKEIAKVAIDGRVENSYKMVPWMCARIMASNPGSIAVCEATEDHRFKRVFLAYGCSRNGFINGCRPLLFIDATFLSGPYKGTLLAATALDANDQLFPVAFGVVGREDYDDWFWFLMHLKGAIGHVQPVIISDRHPALVRSVPEIFGSDSHAYCIRHVKENFSSFLSTLNLGRRKCKDVALEMFDAVAYARTSLQYDKAILVLAAFSPELAKWVEENEPHCWALSKFERKRWDNFTTNPAESFNSWIRNERRYTIFNLINAHREMLASKLYTTSQAIWKNPVGSNVDEWLKLNLNIASNVKANRYSNYEFLIDVHEGNIMVDLAKGFCSCLEWKMSGVPCPHVCAAIKEAKFNIYDFVNDCYKRDAHEKIYAEVMHPVETYDMPSQNPLFDITIGCEADVRDNLLNDLRPPSTKRLPGRPKTKRRESQHQDRKEYRCSICALPGHNRSTCTNPVPSID